MKITFLPFLTKPGPTFWPQKDPNMEFLTQNFNFQSLIRKTEEATIILLHQVCDLLKDWLTKVKTFKIVTFAIFDPKWAIVLS